MKKLIITISKFHEYKLYIKREEQKISFYFPKNKNNIKEQRLI